MSDSEYQLTQDPMNCQDADSLRRRSPTGTPTASETTGGSPVNSSSSQLPSTSNKKRQRASPEQLAILEETFLTNTSPNAKLREILAEKVKMPERSIQIWFQNRRAKVKLMQKRNHLMQEEAIRARYLTSLPGGFNNNLVSYIPAGASRYTPIRSNSYDPQIAAAARGQVPMQSSLRPLAMNPVTMRKLAVANGTAASGNTPGLGANALYDAGTSGSISTLSCQSISIGTWRRIATSPMDLVCYYSVSEKRFTYYINSNAAGFKIEFPFEYVEKITFYINASGVGQATLQVRDTPTFYMEVAGGGWRQCTDFTEGRQASHVNQHVILGDAPTLRAQLLRLSQTDTEFSNRLSFMEVPPVAQDVPVISLPTQSTGGDTSNLQQQLSDNPNMKPGGLDPKAALPKHMHKRQRSRSNSAPLAIQLGLGQSPVDPSTILAGNLGGKISPGIKTPITTSAQTVDGGSLVRTQSFDAMNEDPTGLDTVKDSREVNAAAIAATIASSDPMTANNGGIPNNPLRIDTSVNFLNMFRDQGIIQNAIHSAGIAEGQPMYWGFDDGSMGMMAGGAPTTGNPFSPFPLSGNGADCFGGIDSPMLLDQADSFNSVPQSPYISDDFRNLDISNAAALGQMTTQQLVEANGILSSVSTPTQPGSGTSPSPLAFDSEHSNLKAQTLTDYVDMFTTVGRQISGGDDVNNPLMICLEQSLSS